MATAPITSTAEFLASHALLLVGAAILLTWAASAFVLAAAQAAVQHRERLWALIDLFVPGRLFRPRTYLLVHLALGLVITLAAGSFAIMAENVVGGRQLAAFDLAFADALRTRVSPTWRLFFVIITWLGSGWIVAAAAGVVAGRLFARGRKLLGTMWIISQAGGFAISEVLKRVFARARPLGADLALYDGGWSFPSGHAMSAFVLSGVAAYLLLLVVGSWICRSLLIAGALAWSLLVGFSRLYLGVHYVSDVAAGFLIGVAWVAVCVSATEVALRGRRDGTPRVRGKVPSA
jgi:membrane-associated phospholipid phosphatase